MAAQGGAGGAPSAAAATADLEAAPATTPPGSSLWQRPKPSTATSGAAIVKHGNACCMVPPNKRLYEMRPDVVTKKTRAGEWRQLRSRWRYLHSFFFAWGPPAYIMSRIWPMLLVNMLAAAFVSIDHLLRAAPYTTADGRLVSSFLPDINDHVIESLTPMSRFMLFAAAMLLTLRLGRVYERWWLFRQTFSVVGSTAMALSQRAAAWIQDERIAADIRRWAVAWHWSVYQVCMGEPEISPDGARLLTEEERELYGAAPKGRQLAVDKLLQLITDADLEPNKFLALEMLVQHGVAASGKCVGIKFTAIAYPLSLISAYQSRVP
jgi:hypothetical protein